jgi:hypothetical protein
MRKDWPSEVCSNCKVSSYSLHKNKTCPYCDKKSFVERVARKENSFKDTKELTEYIKKYNVFPKLNDKLKNRIICEIAFKKDDAVDVLKKYFRRYKK